MISRRVGRCDFADTYRRARQNLARIALRARTGSGNFHLIRRGGLVCSRSHRAGAGQGPAPAGGAGTRRGRRRDLSLLSSSVPSPVPTHFCPTPFRVHLLLECISVLECISLRVHLRPDSRVQHAGEANFNHIFFSFTDLTRTIVSLGYSQNQPLLDNPAVLRLGSR